MHFFGSVDNFKQVSQQKKERQDAFLKFNQSKHEAMLTKN
jgi:hypothetical protein